MVVGAVEAGVEVGVDTVSAGASGMSFGSRKYAAAPKTMARKRKAAIRPMIAPLINPLPLCAGICAPKLLGCVADAGGAGFVPGAKDPEPNCGDDCGAENCGEPNWGDELGRELLGCEPKPG